MSGAATDEQLKKNQFATNLKNKQAYNSKANKLIIII